jgi:uncharacterized NAD-dependent epimerase/dehydratase family protein
LIEGQGSLYHPSYAGVTLALIHGGQPDALILCHEPTRPHMRGLPHQSLPTLRELHDTALLMARVVNPDVQVAGISINTAALPDGEAESCIAQIEQEMGLPATDPYRFGAGKLVEALQSV